MLYERKQRLLTIHEIGLSYGDKKILRDVNIHVDNIVRPGLNQGQVVALLGPSGVGKTQLMRLIAGLQAPTLGKITIDGKTTPVEAGEVGFIFQNYPLLEHRTVIGNLELSAKKGGKKHEDIVSYLERFGILDKKNLFPNQLSGGQKQRVAIIQQMLCSSNLMMMDEPFSGLDVKMKFEVCKLISEVSSVNELNTVILTTHDIDTAVRIADTIWIMGFENGSDGKRIPGATCIKQICLIERGLAWNPEIHSHPEFGNTVEEIEQIFMNV